MQLTCSLNIWYWSGYHFKNLLLRGITQKSLFLFLFNRFRVLNSFFLNDLFLQFFCRLLLMGLCLAICDRRLNCMAYIKELFAFWNTVAFNPWGFQAWDQTKKKIGPWERFGSGSLESYLGLSVLTALCSASPCGLPQWLCLDWAKKWWQVYASGLNSCTIGFSSNIIYPKFYSLFLGK